MSFKDYYQVLGVRPDANAEEIKGAYRYLAKRYHPDKKSDSDGAFFNDYMVLVNEANTVLSNPETRRSYDVQMGHTDDDVLVAPPPPQVFVANQAQAAAPSNYKLKNVIPFLLAAFLLVFGTYWYTKTMFEKPVVQPEPKVDKELVQIAEALKNDISLANDYETRLKNTLAQAKLPTENRPSADKITADRQDERNFYKKQTASLPMLGSDNEPKIEEKRGTKKMYNGASPYSNRYGEGSFDSGSYNTLSVRNTQNLDAVVLLVNAQTDDVVRNEFVEAGSTYELKKIPNGDYYLKVILGKDFNPQKSILGGSLQGGFEQDLKLKKFDGENAVIKMQQRFENGKLDFTTVQIRL